MNEQELNPPLSDPVKLVLQSAERIQREQKAANLDASHVLFAFVRRHKPMLARLAGIADIADEPAVPAGVDVDTRSLLDRAAGLAAQSGDKMTDLRHLGVALIERFELASTADAPAGARSSSTASPTQKHGAGGILERYGRDLTELARAGKLSPLIGRDEVLDEVLDVLCRRLKRNPLLVGPPGAGKTAIAEGLAQRVVAGTVPDELREMQIVEVSASALIAQAKYVGQLVELTQQLIEAARAPGVVIFLDEFQTAVEFSGRDLGIAGQLKPALARGEIACIGAMAEADYHRLIVGDAALDRRFEPVRVAPLSAANTLDVLRAVALTLTNEPISEQTLTAIVELSEQYLRNRQLPDKAIDVLDRTVGRAKRMGVAASAELAADVVGAMTGLPLGSDGQELAMRLGGLLEFLDSRVVGQEEAARIFTEHLALKMRNLDLRPERPNGVFLFTGPTGTGKTEMARATAEYLFGSPDRLVRLDMSEYREEHYISKLLGAPPGYVGYDGGSPILDELLSRPFALVLLDEIEKAHPAVHRYFLQVFDDGFLTSGAGKRVYFSDAVIVMTSNIDVRRTQRHAGFTGGEETIAELDSLKDVFPPEFINRIDAVCTFKPLEREDVMRIVRDITIKGWNERNASSGLHLELSDTAIEYLAAGGYNEQLGARELQRVVERDLLNQIPGIVKAGERAELWADVQDGRIALHQKGRT